MTRERECAPDPMRIVWLLESAAPPSAGVLRALDAAERLAARGHDVLVLQKDRPEPAAGSACVRRQVAAFDADTIPPCDAVVATSWTTVPSAVRSGRGAPVQYCQDYEPLGIQDPALRARAEAAYRLPAHKVAIAPHLASLLRQHGAGPVDEIIYAIDQDRFRPASAPRPVGAVTRVGIVGPWSVGWKGIRSGVEACRLALQSGLALRLVRVSAFEPDAEETALGVPTEWHVRVPHDEMGAIYHGLDVLLGTSTGAEECFFPPAVEAMASGVPCVLTDVPCFRGYAPGRSDYALFVEPQNVHEMAEALTLTACHQGLRGQLRDAGLAVAARFDPERHAHELEGVLERAARSGPLRTDRRLASCDPRDVCAPAPSPAEPAPDDDAAEEQLLVTALRERGDRLLRADRFADAVAAYAAALRLRPADPQLRDRVGSAAFLAGDAERALREFDQLLASTDPIAADARVWHEKRGLVLIGLDRWSEAARAFERAARCTDADADTFNSFGVALHELGDVAGARRAFREALRREPAHADATRNLAEMW
ncbi:MAG: glycosyltransferase [Planctomycetes bacterium]|nr:glycosyltransferase [Planctomycetota bacterium]